MGDFIVANNITTVQQLFAKADARKQEGESDLANFLFSRTQKTIAELMSKSWLLKQASSEIQRDEITRIEKVRNAAENACVDGCNGSWFECAIEVLSLNNKKVELCGSCFARLVLLGEK